jgi:hypothetical protein
VSSSVASVRDGSSEPSFSQGRPSGRESGPQVIALGFALTLTAVSIDLLLSGSLSLFFDLTFVASCLLLARQVRPSDFFTVGVLPPLMMLGVFVLAGVVAPGLIAHPRDGVVQAVVSGLSVHAGALIAGYLLALGVLVHRARRAHRPVEDLL